MKLGIGGRLLLAHLAISILVIGAVELALAPMLRDELREQLTDRLSTAAAALARQLDEGTPAPFAATAISQATGYRMTVIGTEGTVLADSAVAADRLADVEPHGTRPEVIEARLGTRGISERRSATTGERLLYVAVAGDDGKVSRGAANLDDLDATMAAAHRAVLLAAGLGLALAVLLGTAASAVAGRTVRELNRAARRMAEGDLTELHVPRGPGELGEISLALERLARQLAGQFGRLTAERDMLEAVLASMEEAVIVLRPDGSVLLANSAANHLLALPRKAQDQPLIETIRFPALLDAVQRAARGEAAGLELVLQGPPRRELVGRAAPLPKGAEAAVVVVLRDLTELRRLEAMRRDFVASASHELRTPVAVIRGYAETLAGGALDDRAAAERFVGGLSRQAERLSALIDDLLDLSRVESGGLRLAPEALSAPDVLRRLAEIARDRAERKGLQLVVEPAPPELRVRADPRAIDMVVGNLLDNAIKYTPSGGRVTLSAAPLDGSVRFVVADTGPGIEAQHLSRIFERFYRVDAGRSRDVGGTGLGLAIAKHVAQQSGGDVGVESRPGAGSRFWVRLPAA